MGPGGPSEEDKNYIVDTGASGFSMGQQVEAYRESMYLPPGNVLFIQILQLTPLFWAPLMTYTIPGVGTP